MTNRRESKRHLNFVLRGLTQSKGLKIFTKTTVKISQYDLITGFLFLKLYSQYKKLNRFAFNLLYLIHFRPFRGTSSGLNNININSTSIITLFNLSLKFIIKQYLTLQLF